MTTDDMPASKAGLRLFAEGPDHAEDSWGWWADRIVEIEREAWLKGYADGLHEAKHMEQSILGRTQG